MIHFLDESARLNHSHLVRDSTKQTFGWLYLDVSAFQLDFARDCVCKFVLVYLCKFELDRLCRLEAQNKYQ
jgi:hypothetical protein